MRPANSRKNISCFIITIQKHFKYPLAIVVWFSPQFWWWTGNHEFGSTFLCPNTDKSKKIDLMYHGPKSVKGPITHDPMKWVLHRVSMYYCMIFVRVFVPTSLDFPLLSWKSNRVTKSSLSSKLFSSCGSSAHETSKQKWEKKCRSCAWKA